MSQDELVPNSDRSLVTRDSASGGCTLCFAKDPQRLEREQVELELALLGGKCSIVMGTILLPIALIAEWHAKSNGYPSPINEMVWGALLSPFAGAAWVKLKYKLPWGKK